MKNAVRIELVSLVLFIAAFASLNYSINTAGILLWASILLSYLCFLVELLPKYRTHKIVALAHANFGFLIYLISIPLLHLSNYLLNWPHEQTIIMLTLALLVPLAVFKLTIISVSLRRFERIDPFWFLAGLPILFLSGNIYILVLFLCATVFVSTSLLRSHDYLGFKDWISVSMVLLIYSSIVGFSVVLFSDLHTSGIGAAAIFTMIFVFESTLSARYMDMKDRAFEELGKSKVFQGLVKEIKDRYNLSLTLLAQDLVAERRDISPLGIVKKG